MAAAAGLGGRRGTDRGARSTPRSPDTSSSHGTDYRPKAALRRFVQARDRHCQFPGSNRSATHCDLDHIDEFKEGEGGTTSADNLTALSRTAHRGKTHSENQLKRNDDGTLTWTTPFGRQYRAAPHDCRPDSER